MRRTQKMCAFWSWQCSCVLLNCKFWFSRERHEHMRRETLVSPTFAYDDPTRDDVGVVTVDINVRQRRFARTPNGTSSSDQHGTSSSCEHDSPPRSPPQIMRKHCGRRLRLRSQNLKNPLQRILARLEKNTTPVQSAARPHIPGRYGAPDADVSAQLFVLAPAPEITPDSRRKKTVDALLVHLMEKAESKHSRRSTPDHERSSKHDSYTTQIAWRRPTPLLQHSSKKIVTAVRAA